MLQRTCTVPFLVFFICFMLMVNWEYSKVNTALALDQIPEDSIRLRILAHSDTPRDQWVKGKVREAIVSYMEDWSQQLSSIEAARLEIKKRLPQIQRMIEDLLTEMNIHQQVKVELGIVPFPTKMYGGKVYPAGDYEALRVTLGAGKGQNWWCVLFPPLCFVDGQSGEALAASDEAALADEEQTEIDDFSSDVEMRFFLVELIEKLWSWLKGLVG